jgi:hypothetical protein
MRWAAFDDRRAPEIATPGHDGRGECRVIPNEGAHDDDGIGRREIADA